MYYYYIIIFFSNSLHGTYRAATMLHVALLDGSEEECGAVDSQKFYELCMSLSNPSVDRVIPSGLKLNNLPFLGLDRVKSY